MGTPDRIYLGEGIALQRRGETWWLDIYRAGRRIRRSLGTQDDQNALEIGTTLLSDLRRAQGTIEVESILAAMCNCEQEEMFRSLAEKGCWIGRDPRNESAKLLRDLAFEGIQTEDALRRVVREEVHGRRSSTTLTSWDDALGKFEKSKAKKVGAESLKNIIRDVREFIDASGVPTVEAVTPAHVDEWVSDLQAKGKSAKTAANKRVNLSSLFTWAHKVQRLIPSNPVSDTEAPKIIREDPEYLTRDQVVQRMERIKGKPWEWIAGLSLYAGLRLGDISRLDPAKSIDIPGRNIHFRESKRNRQNIVRNVPILDQALPYVMMIPKEGFYWKDSKQISKDTCAAGVGNLLCRHTFETHLRLCGVLPQAVGDLWLGHDAKTGAEHYAGWWKPSEPAMSLTYFGLPLVKTGIPEVSAAARNAYKTV